MTDNIQNGDGVEVIQSDREFAAHWIVIAPENARRIRNGEWDSHHGVQAAARHRHSLAREPATADVERVKKAWKAIVREFGDYMTYDRHGHYPEKTEMDEAVAALSRAAPSSEPAIAEGEHRLLFKGAVASIIHDFNPKRGSPIGHPSEWTYNAADAILAALAQSSTPPASKGVEAREGCIGTMDAARATYFLERFKREEKWLGPHEQWALDYTIAALAASPTPSNDTLQGRGEVEADRTWFGYQRRLSLSFYSPMYGDDDDQSEEWRVTQESGPINDREWDIVGRGQTVDEAISAARDALQKDTRHDG